VKKSTPAAPFHQQPDRQKALIAGLLALFVIGSFLPVFQNGFVNYDDPGYVYRNRHVASGLTPETFGWAFTTFQESNWHPLTWISHALDVTLFGMSAPLHHGMSLLLHLISTILLFFLLERMTGSRWPAAFVALVFGIHPLHVESVAWISERKDVLSGLFMMLTLMAYARYAKSGDRGDYLKALGLFALGLLAKPMLVTLPFVLLLLDYWPLGRLGRPRGPAGGPAPPRFRVLIEKVPFLLLTVCSSIVTYSAQEWGGAIAEGGALLFSDRAANAATSYLGYLLKTFFPVDLAFFYPHRMDAITPTEIGASLFVFAGVSVWVWKFRRRRPFLLTGWAIFLGMLVPVIGLVQVGLQAMADRYMYLPLTGIAIMIGWGAPAVLRSRRARSWILRPGFIVVALAMGVLTWRQTGVWRTNESLYGHALEVTRGNHIAHTNLGVTLAEEGRDLEAIPHFREALRLWPRNLHNISNLARSLGAIGEYDAALGFYRRIIPNVRQLPLLQIRVADVFKGLGLPDSALTYYAMAVRLDSTTVEAHLGMAEMYSELSQFDSAREAAARIFRLEPGSARGHDVLGIIAGREGRLEEAEEEFTMAIRADSLDEQAYIDLGILYEKTGRAELSIGQYRTASRLNPRSSLAHFRLGTVLARLGDLAAAEEEWLLCLKAQPAHTDARMNLGRLYTMWGNPEKAAVQYRAIIASDPARTDIRLLLANARLMQGDTAGAVSEYNEVLRIQPGSGEATAALGRLKSAMR
jgi:tetratricopeptide (TPR) repeat protein